MALDFDYGVDSRDPIGIEAAIERGRSLVVRRVYRIMFTFDAFAVFVGMITGNWITGLSLIVAGFVLGWLWWSYSVPRWRSWALGRGVDPEQLQRAGEQAKLLWPRGHILEKTEFRFRGSKSAV